MRSSKIIRITLALTAALSSAIASPAFASTIESVYVDHGAIGPRPPEAAGRPTVDSHLAKRVVDALIKRGIKAVETTTAIPQTGPRDLYISLSYATSIQRTDRPEKYRGYAVYLSQQNPVFDVSLSCGFQVAKALSDAGEHPWGNRPGNVPTLLDPVGLREAPGMTEPKTMKGPAIFIDAGSLADETERLRLATPSVLAKMADAIAEGISLCSM